MREVTRCRQGQADDPALGAGVGGLPDLSVEGSDAGGVDDHPTLPLGVGVGLRDGLGGDGEDSEGADEVDLDDAPVERQVVPALPAQDARTRADARTVDHGPQRTARVAGGLRDRCPHLLLVGHVGRHVTDALGRLGLGDLAGEVGMACVHGAVDHRHRHAACGVVAPVVDVHDNRHRPAGQPAGTGRQSQLQF